MAEKLRELGDTMAKPSRISAITTRYLAGASESRIARERTARDEARETFHVKLYRREG